MKKAQNGVEGRLVPVTRRAKAGDKQVCAVCLDGGCIPGWPEDMNAAVAG